nr:tetratricopeptide repeat protein [Caldilineaceae bacterium]
WYTHFGGFDIRKNEHRQLAERFAASPDLTSLGLDSQAITASGNAEAGAHFQAGLAHYQAGDVQAALSAWRKGVELDPTNWIIRKQVWAIENPEHFYAGEVDYEWQRKQIAQNR